MSRENLSLPEVRGSYRFDADLSKTTWFRVGGKAQVLFKPEDEDDLSYFMANKPDELPIFVLGVGSNILIRDGGIKGVVIKLGKNFANISHESNIINCGAACLDVNVANYAMQNNVGGLEFLVGVPGTIGGAIRMNAGAYGRETSEVLSLANAVNSKGEQITLSNHDFGFKYRGSKAPKDLIFTSATFEGNFEDSGIIKQKMDDISKSREESQPIRSRTGGSTFKNPEGAKAWELIDKVGLRGYSIGGAQFSEKHCNFLINTGNASAKDIESLGELARARVRDAFGIDLEWEIKIIGDANE
ncbi:MAG: UDP-N-acetylmuramate dehydrogenase [Alphaproteobacteria bacterium]|nr:UDP-N-acetylmuramate dehydrogenase [Alphaproteobacteria bacterium]OJV15988.1 MAG: UDP-N-acetylenolpyruvoylglucosamine reductase [Alphaproteobacteria bacterium 33-17]